MSFFATCNCFNGSTPPDPPPATDPVIQSYSYGNYYDDNDVSGNYACTHAATASAIPGMFLYSTDGLLAADGIRVFFSDATHLDFSHSLDPFLFISWGDTYAVIKDPGLAGKHVTGAVPITLGGVAIGTPAVLDIPFFPVGIAAKPTSDPEKIVAGYSTPLTGALPLSLHAQDCSGAGAVLTYYDPAGPSAGLNPVSADIQQWDVDAIIIFDAVNIVGFTPYRIALRNATGEGFAVYGNPLPEV